jgi:hypothetical protein
VLGGAIRGTWQRPDIRLVCGSRGERAERIGSRKKLADKSTSMTGALS